MNKTKKIFISSNFLVQKISKRFSRKAQIWVETVIYTLIGLAILGLVLGLALPKINQLKDKTIIDQSVEILNNIDRVVRDIKYVSGNSRQVDIRVQKGQLRIDSGQDSIRYIIEDSKYKYSELDEKIPIGNIEVLTEEKTEDYKVTLEIDYSPFLNITWEGGNQEKVLQPSSQPHTITISNKGSINAIPNIDFS